MIRKQPVEVCVGLRRVEILVAQILKMLLHGVILLNVKAVGIGGRSRDLRGRRAGSKFWRSTVSLRSPLGIPEIYFGET